MKKVFFIAALALATITANAQHAVGSWSIQPKVGMTIANVTDRNSDYKVGAVAGAEVEYQVTDLIGISAGALYSMQGNKYETTVLGKTVTTKGNLDYINVPIMANFYVYKNLALKVGVQPGFNVAANTTVDGDEIASGTDGINTVDFSIPVGISYEYANFVLDARYNWGLTKVSKDAELLGVKIDGAKGNNSVFQITLGYKFDL